MFGGGGQSYTCTRGQHQTPAALTLGRTVRMNGRLDGLHSRSGRIEEEKNILSLPRNEPRTVQPWHARYTACLILAPFYMTPIYIPNLSFKITWRILFMAVWMPLLISTSILNWTECLTFSNTYKMCLSVCLCRCPREWIVIRHMSEKSDIK